MKGYNIFCGSHEKRGGGGEGGGGEGGEGKKRQ